MLAVVLILLVPLIAMQLTDEVNWTVFDFMAAAVLLLGTGFMIELGIRKIKNKTYRIAVILGILAALLIIWAELAVGVFKTMFGGS